MKRTAAPLQSAGTWAESERERSTLRLYLWKGSRDSFGPLAEGQWASGAMERSVLVPAPSDLGRHQIDTTRSLLSEPLK